MKEKYMQFKPLSPWHAWVCGRVLEGTLDQGLEVGVWNITVQRFIKGWGILNDEDYPFDSDVWPPQQIGGDLQKAKSNRSWCYQFVRNATDGCNAIDRNHGFCASFEITDQWSNAKDGIIQFPISGDIIGSHAIAFLQYSLNSRSFHFVNSWGANWGHHGHGLLGFDFFNTYQLEGFCSYADQRPHLVYTHKYQYIRHGYIGFAGIPIHICEIYDHLDDNILAWAFVVQRDGFLDIEELYVKPRYRGIGLGNELIKLILDVQKNLKMPLRSWITHVDNKPELLCVTDTLLAKLGLRREPSPMRWAAYLATDAVGDTKSRCISQISPSVPLMIIKHYEQNLRRVTTHSCHSPLRNL